MAKQNIAQKVEEHIRPIIEDLGYELVKVEYAKKVDGYHMTVFIDSENGIALEDCEKVHRKIDEPLDALDPTEGAYVLNVSSCGLDWPLVSDRDFQKNIGKQIDVSLFAPIDRKKNYTGTLVGFDKSNITVKDKSEITLPRSAIAKATQHIDF